MTRPIANSILDVVGDTPLISIDRVAAIRGAQARVLVKVEAFNPAGSAKDRAALGIIRAAEKSGELAPGSTIIEATSGNTGIGLAAVAAVLGYRVIICMPDSMSAERRMLMSAYGAQLVLTPGAKGMKGAIEKAEELAERIPGSIIAGQFVNEANPNAHYRTTGPEIWEATDGSVNAFVAGIGTGGTITGVGRYLKEQNPAIQVVGVEPADSPLLSGGKAGPHKLQGIGANFVPDILDTSIVNRITTCTTEEAFATARLLAEKEGLLCGISSGAAAWAALELAKEECFAGSTIVALLPDTGERYLSSGLFEEHLFTD